MEYSLNTSVTCVFAALPVVVTGKQCARGLGITLLLIAGPLLSASAAHAFDCKLASTKSEKAICADPLALAADAELSKSFGDLRGRADSGQREAMMKAQQHWVAARDNECGDKKAAGLSACIARASRQRMLFLTATAAAGPGAPGKLAPFFRIEKGGKGRTNVDIQVFKFVDPHDPSSKTFNAEVDKLMSKVPQPEADETSADNFDFSVSMELTYASPRLMSAHVATSSFLGGAHPNIETANINIDTNKGALADFNDLLDGAAAKKIYALCERQVVQQKKQNGGGASLDADALKTLRETIGSVTPDLAMWSFGAEKASIVYDSDVLGAHAEGSFFCDVPYATLRGLSKPAFPLP